MLLKNQYLIEEIKEEIKRYLETNDNEDTKPKTYGDTAKSVLWEVYSNTNSGKKKKLKQTT